MVSFNFTRVGMKRRLFVFTMALLLTPAAPAATIPVDTLEDDDAVNGNCTLREAIGAANADKPVDACVAGRGNDRIDLRGLTGALNLTGALPGLSTGIEIAGPGAEALTIRRESGGNYRIFTVSANVAIEGLTLANGVSDEFGGGILNSGALRVSDSVIAHGSARRGGGIYNDAGTISLKKSEISDNVASDIRGGGIYNQSGTVAATDTVIRDNVAEGGGRRCL
jgi:CSLREA domain-containing protein